MSFGINFFNPFNIDLYDNNECPNCTPILRTTVESDKSR